MSTTLPAPDRQRTGGNKTLVRAAVIGILILLVAIALGSMMMRMSDTPANLDLSTTRLSQQGLYKVSYTPDQGIVAINTMQSWTLYVERSSGQPVENATVTVDGDMPQHRHGLPTRPQVTQNLGNGNYRVDGLRFHMPGWWVVDFVITADGQTDRVQFNMMLR
ncbi:MAG: FixH family protein [Caldilineaceae bacterium]|nr:FixH family protein [Caldilineaceae bacterium]